MAALLMVAAVPAGATPGEPNGRASDRGELLSVTTVADLSRGSRPTVVPAGDVEHLAGPIVARPDVLHWFLRL